MSLAATKTPNLGSQEPRLNAVRVQTSAYGMVIPVVFGTNRSPANMIWGGDFTAIPHSTSMNVGKGGSGGGSGSTTYTYTISFAMGLCEGEIAGVGKIWEAKKKYAAPFGSMVVFTGIVPQTPWTYLQTKHPEQALSYSGIAYVAYPNYDMGTSNSLPNFTYEIKGLKIISGTQDANPADIIKEISTNNMFGLGLDPNIIDVADYYNYCMAADLLISPVYNQQKTAADHIRELCDITNAEPIWHDGSVLLIVPYGDTEMTGNGITWTPNINPIYDLTDEDFICDKNDVPIRIKRPTTADAFNIQQIEYVNRDNDYNVDYAEAQDQSNIDQYGKRDAEPITCHHITRTNVARTCAQMIMQRGLYIRNEYSFVLGWKYCLIEPMDILTITDSRMGMDKFPVRVVEIEENDDGEFDIVAEDFPAGAGHAALYETQPIDGYVIDYNIEPGNINEPQIFMCPGILTETGHEVWAAVSGGDNWGGCDVWASVDGITYKFIARKEGGSRYGTLTADFPAMTTDPDIINICSVNLGISRGELLSGSQSDADNNITACIVDNEIISYQTATLTSEYNYDLSYLRREVYNSISNYHGAGARFVRIDDGILRIPYDTTMKIGDKIWVKFVSFNIYHANIQDLADVEPYEFTIGRSLTYPSNTTTFHASQNGEFVVFFWEPVTERNIVGYEIRYAPQGGCVWSDGIPLTVAEQGTHLVSNKIAPGNWTFMICAIDKSGNYSRTPLFYDLTVINANLIIAGGVGQAELGWPGIIDDLVEHYTTVLTPRSNGVAADDGWDTFDKYVPNPIQYGSYTAPEFVLTGNKKIRVHGEIVSSLGPGITEGVAAPLLYIKWHLDGGEYNDWTPWTIGEITAKNITFRFENDCLVGMDKIINFYPTIDIPSRVESGSNVYIDPGGTQIFFGVPYEMPPLITATARGTSSITCVVADVAVDYFIVVIYDTVTGYPVEGYIDWKSEGY